jgi:probable aminopeptidase NPEPL1
MPTTLSFHSAPDALRDASVLLFIGRRERLLSDAVRALLPPGVSPAMWTNMLGTGTVADDGRVAATWLDGRPERLLAGLLPDACSRHNTPGRSWAVPHLVAAARGASRLGVLIAPDDASHAWSQALGVARALPTFTASADERERAVDVVFLPPVDADLDLARMSVAADAVRRAAHLVDMPPSALGPRAMVAEARAVAARLDRVSIHVIAGDDLREHGFGGLWGVGKAATEPPALVVLEHEPPGATSHQAWVGKGILFDTGGLSLKDKTSMPGMKTDMGGAAAVLCAFEAAVRSGVRHRITAVLCLAENAIGPSATRPDDILRLYSGRTVEVNNTDAEGRLVLADGIAWALRHRKPNQIYDLATLTGAQSIATGKRHAAIISNHEALERAAVDAGQRSGDLCFALPFCPEFYRREFQSRVADMKNSVKDRNNAQSSCAAEFIHMNMDNDDTPWLHVDMAAPAHSSERGTGFGVGLLLTLAGVGA